MIEVWNDLQVLQHGVVVETPEVHESGRIEMSAGTVAASLADGDYENGAVIPAGGWHELSRMDREILSKNDSSCQGDARILIVQVSSQIIDRFRELREFASYSHVDEVRSRVSTVAVRDAINRCMADVRHYYGLRMPMEPEHIAGGIRVNLANLPTVTVNPETGKLVGLHVDNWSRTPLNTRNLAPKRICINLGNHHRYFLFLNLSIRQLMAAAQEAAFGKDSALIRKTDINPSTLRRFDSMSSGTHAARTFMACSPAYPVLRLKVYPGEAYIAPTENIVHDGSSLGASSPDVSLSLREAP